jgi:hypothetical protein
VVFKVCAVGASEIRYLPEPWGGYLSGFVATTTIRRSDFDRNANFSDGLCTVVRIKVEVESVKRGRASTESGQVRECPAFNM